MKFTFYCANCNNASLFDIRDGDTFTCKFCTSTSRVSITHDAVKIDKKSEPREKPVAGDPMEDWLRWAKQSKANNSTVTTGREHVLATAKNAVLSDRNKEYGNPEDNFRNIADVWNWYLEGKTAILGIPPIDSRCKITPLDVAHLMQLMKLARLKTNPTHMDSIVDVAGYAACAGDFATKPEPANMAMNAIPTPAGGEKR